MRCTRLNRIEKLLTTSWKKRSEPSASPFWERDFEAITRFRMIWGMFSCCRHGRRGRHQTEYQQHETVWPTQQLYFTHDEKVHCASRLQVCPRIVINGSAHAVHAKHLASEKNRAVKLEHDQDVNHHGRKASVFLKPLLERRF